MTHLTVRQCPRRILSDPERRFQNAADMKVALAELSEEPESGDAVTASDIRSVTRRTKRWPWAAAAVALIVAAAIARYILWPPAPPPPPLRIVPRRVRGGARALAGRVGARIHSGHVPSVEHGRRPHPAGTLADPFPNGINAPVGNDLGLLIDTGARVRSPFRKNRDFALQKSARTGTVRTSFRLEIINVFDTPDFDGAITGFDTGNVENIVNVHGYARTFQFTLRFID